MANLISVTKWKLDLVEDAIHGGHLLWCVFAGSL
jgi:hypothetical protein